MKFALIKGQKAYELSKGDFKSPIVEIPNEYNGFPVIRIDSFAFHNAKKMIKVILPDSLKEIGYYAFSGCLNLTTVVFPDSLKSIGKSGFLRCAKLKNIFLPDQLKKIGESSFDGCSNLQKVVLPENLVSLGKRAFADCISLTEISIPKKLLTLSEELFYRCIKLKKVHLFPNITTFKKGVFYGCESLEVDVNFIPSSIQKIPNELFFQCKKIKQLVLPETLVQLGKSAFYGCSSLRSINIPPNIKTIPKSCFVFCEKLEYIELHDEIETIEEEAFQFTNIMKIHIPPLVKVITKRCFSSCYELKEVILPEAVIRIEEEAFENCSNLKTINLPITLERIEKNAFAICFNLEIDYLPNDFVDIHNEAFSTESRTPTEVDPTYLALRKQKKYQSPESKTTSTKTISWKDEEGNEEDGICMWCEQERPNVDWHDDADPENPICEHCYNEFLKEKENEKNEENFNTIKKKKSTLKITQILPYQLDLDSAKEYYTNLQEYSSWITICHETNSNGYILDYSLPRSFFSEGFIEIISENINLVKIPAKIYHFKQTKPLVEVFFNKPNSFKFDNRDLHLNSKSLLVPYDEYEEKIKNLSVKTIKSNQEVLLFYPNTCYFIPTYFVDLTDPYSDDPEFYDLFSEENIYSLNVYSVVGVFSFQGFATYRQKENLKFGSAAYIDKKSNQFVPDFINNLFNHKKLSKTLPQKGIIQIGSPNDDDLELFIVNLSDCLELIKIISELKLNPIINMK